MGEAQAGIIALQTIENTPEATYSEIWKYSKISLLTFVVMVVILLGMFIFAAVLLAYTVEDAKHTNQDVLPGLSFGGAIAVFVVLVVASIILLFITVLYRTQLIPRKVEKLRQARANDSVEKLIEMRSMS